ncbi:ATP-binding cassette domain-containing protein [Catenuloplanes atrovinosus]|uniref:Energy-coupling factor transporter ATP-binding protein EcfA2 n=1 Tax=Catenuloplanes atrovinosus TaxID=137266 RepID=A0AAE3YPP6_9ACTN|nr:ATP-binding cassette domain-containing protein [Catenuloplanes atrovinosus]MDR7277400.1 energy-coupling factor transporter ATP-binding protein EcfA2 [Catenuloplanes atrovinosus]
MIPAESSVSPPVARTTGWTRTTEPIIEADAVGFAARAGVPALTGVSPAVHGGRSVALAGESGTGETTLPRLLLGQARPTTGEIRFDGAPLHRGRLRDYRRARPHQPREDHRPWAVRSHRRAVTSRQRAVRHRAAGPPCREIAWCAALAAGGGGAVRAAAGAGVAWFSVTGGGTGSDAVAERRRRRREVGPRERAGRDHAGSGKMGPRCRLRAGPGRPGGPSPAGSGDASARGRRVVRPAGGAGPRAGLRPAGRRRRRGGRRPRRPGGRTCRGWYS